MRRPMTAEDMRAGSWLIYVLAPPPTLYLPVYSHGDTTIFVSASEYVDSVGWDGIYQSAWKAARQHPLCQDKQYSLDSVGYVGFDFMIEEYYFLFGLRVPLSVVEEELEEWRQQAPEGMKCIVMPSAAEDLRLAKILLVAPEPIPGLDKKCVWGDGLYKVRIDQTE